LINKAIVAKVKALAKLLLVALSGENANGFFVAKKPYVDPSLYISISENTLRLNTHGEHCHR
jgi:hypothetical protein